MRRVAVLCGGLHSYYKAHDAVEVFDKERDALTFKGGMPVVAHPPCRGWSIKTRHQAKPDPGELDLGLWCVDQLKRWGGVLEQPAHSKLWEAAGLPVPGKRLAHAWGPDVWSLGCSPRWWADYAIEKATWLCFVGIPEQAIEVPYKLQPQLKGSSRQWANMSTRQRSLTPPAMCTWLLQAARAVQYARVVSID